MNTDLAIDSNTRIARIISYPGAIDALIAVSSRFNKLKNPVLRKVMAGQVNVAMAARIGGVSGDAILESLERIGFRVSRESEEMVPANERFDAGPRLNEREKAALLQDYESIESHRIFLLDARPFLEKGEEPLSEIIRITGEMNVGDGLCIINSFAPEPLLPLLKKKGLEGVIVEVEQAFEARFIRRKSGEPEPAWRPASAEPVVSLSEKAEKGNIDGPLGEIDLPEETERGTMVSHSALVIKISVVGLAPPQPMMLILSTLQQMKGTQLLYVMHEREPRFLFPHLAEQGYDYRISSRGPGDVRLLIGRKR